MLVRYKDQYSGLQFRLSYELVTESIVWAEYNGEWRLCYYTKILGCIAEYLLEETTGEDCIPAIDVLVNLEQ